ncbi:TIGR04219 family outer membrane beta-barrel protein [Vibrio sp. 10N.222.51.C8]|uniref:TIGR04219 family outer membrane beta-barrel protein n=1 Tax=unclassified Vibrio TaxID=2614977 RepID=UPI000C8287A5|nr:MULTISPECIES: TIGR04219 family outer membrane beta-barrel protein [unclassified Vibrio]PMK22245.1 iron-hydroxamate ABC transporter substrate-binding protein [Vibrio sp. 10N.261.54.C3]PMN98333.1 iron-hydroxamate ABC transporter substrate-binding protein [Vibrio sp. 10N.222.55.C12]PMO12752.1 iron-hydroxamate ABC transporter substrate-binding protein [Vibrio sp. 10N.222.54.F10]PMO14356.1 iron-hydroxamate ABC transporter substrate-binding protein [Vibrio sp. 10N.222.54.B6]TKF41083.1 TIGR04219 f
MNKMPLIALVGMLSLSSAVSAEEEFSYTAKVGADMWWGSTKLNEVRQDDDSNSPSLYFAFEHNAPMLPNASFRYTSVDADSLAFDKYDYTFYYTLLDHKLMNFDAGVTFTQYSNSNYIEPKTGGAQTSFDEFTWSFYGNAEINVPDTNFDIIGTMEFGDSSGIKSTDLMAGVQYRIPVSESEIALRGGYRVIDLDSDEFFSSELGKSFVMVDGWFAGAEVRF